MTSWQVEAEFGAEVKVSYWQVGFARNIISVVVCHVLLQAPWLKSVTLSLAQHYLFLERHLTLHEQGGGGGG